MNAAIDLVKKLPVEQWPSAITDRLDSLQHVIEGSSQSPASPIDLGFFVGAGFNEDPYGVVRLRESNPEGYKKLSSREDFRLGHQLGEVMLNEMLAPGYLNLVTITVVASQLEAGQ